MSKNNIARTWMKNLHGLRADERGAESSEFILLLVLLVIGVMVGWGFLKGKILSKTSDVGNCIASANSGDCTG